MATRRRWLRPVGNYRYTIRFEGYAPEGAKRRYPAHFLSKLTDADGELQETRHWVLTAAACGYLDTNTERDLAAACLEVGGMLGSMIAKHDKFCIR